MKVTMYSFKIGGRAYDVPIDFSEYTDRFETVFLGKTFASYSVRALKRQILQAAEESEGILWTYGWHWRPDLPVLCCRLTPICVGEQAHSEKVYSDVDPEENSPRRIGEVHSNEPRDGLLLPWTPDPHAMSQRYDAILQMLEDVGRKYRLSMQTALGLEEDSFARWAKLATVEAADMEGIAIRVLKDAISILSAKRQTAKRPAKKTKTARRR